MGKSQKNYMSIKSKLMAAVAMLLVASFMVVSSTYAWFTLSTAPEVTGIQTKIGANGSLEMALLYYNHKTDAETTTGEDGATVPVDFDSVTLDDLLEKVTAGVGSSVAATENAFISNKSWGNIVTLDLAEYGLDKVTLLPSSLNAGVTETDGTKTVTLASGIPLYTPTYGSDGRIEALSANTLARLYNDGAYSAEGYGVRILGTASGMAAHEMGYSNAKANASSAINKALSYSKAALGEAAKTLGSLMVDKAMNQVKSEYDVTGLKQMIANLETANQNLASAIRYFLEAEIANKSVTVATENMPASQVYSAVVAELNKKDDDAIIAFVIAGGDTITGTLGNNTVSLTFGNDATLKALAEQYGRIKAQIAEANTAYTAIGTPSKATVDQANAVVNKVVTIDSMKLEGKTVDEWKATPDYVTVLFNTFTANGNKLYLTIERGTSEYGDSVFAKFAIATGQNLSQNTQVNIQNGGMTLPAAAVMSTDVETTDLSKMLIMGATFPEKPAASANEEKVLSDYYGYGIDLAFRTNAANSNLCLQIDPVGRIYSDGNEATMGHGSNMTFKVDYTAWGLKIGTETNEYVDAAAANAQAAKLVANLANAIRIVFTDARGKVVSFAKLAVPTAMGDNGEPKPVSVENIVFTDEYNAETATLKLPIMLYEVEVRETTYVSVPAVKDAQGEITTPEQTAPSGLAYDTTWTPKNYVDAEKKDSQIIMPLNQNEKTALSVTVYLDGHVVDNSMVASSGTISMGGQLNLQFSSDADLTAMSYTPLQGGGSGSTESGS